MWLIQTYPFYTEGNWGLERFSHPYEYTNLGNEGMGLEPKLACLQSLCSFSATKEHKSFLSNPRAVRRSFIV